VLPASNEVIWFSERDDWGQLYLYDLATGRLKSKITSGAGNVAQLLRIDEKNRTLYFVGNARERGRDPYFRHFYKIGMDGKGLTLLTPEDADHEITLSPSGRYFVDTYSRPDVPQISVLRDLNGKTVLALEKADISRLLATGWKPPMRITVKARDGKTDLYGLMYSPTTLDSSTAVFPIINHIYPGPQTGSVGSRSFSPARGDAQALAELGFVVVEIQVISRRVLWPDGRQHAARPGCRDEGAGSALSVDRHQPCWHLRPLGRRLRRRGRDVSLSGLLQGRHF